MAVAIVWWAVNLQRDKLLSYHPVWSLLIPIGSLLTFQHRLGQTGTNWDKLGQTVVIPSGMIPIDPYWVPIYISAQATWYSNMANSWTLEVSRWYSECGTVMNNKRDCKGWEPLYVVPHNSSCCDWTWTQMLERDVNFYCHWTQVLVRTVESDF